MTALNRDASRAALDAGHTCATDVTGFGLLGHLLKLCRASGVDAVLEVDAVPVLDAARPSLADGYVPGGSLRNLDWVRDSLTGDASEDDLVVLADAPTTGGLLVARELPGHPVIGHLVARDGAAASITVR
jgi:selenide,water dikinase